MPPPIAAAGRLGISYRTMTVEDLPFIAALFASTRAEEVAATGWPPEAQAAFLDQQHRAQHMHYQRAYEGAEWLIVERDADAIGRLYLYESGDLIELIDISLLPESRGAGLGGAILADLLADADSRGKRIDLYVEKYNPARRLYSRLGFETAEDVGVYDRMTRASRSG